MKYFELEDVMLAKGYSMNDVYFTVADFLSDHENDRRLVWNFNYYLQNCLYFASYDVHRYSKMLTLDDDKIVSSHYSCNVYEALGFLLEKKKFDRYFPVDSDELTRSMLYDLWFNLELDDSRYDDGWQLILEDL
nr:MAG TPA: hypothetical protein [Microviridae sp.]